LSLAVTSRQGSEEEAEASKRAKGESNAVADISSQLNAVIATYADEFVGREKELRMTVLSLTSKEHIFLVSPPGTGKTMMRRVAESFGFSFFYYLMNYDVKLEDIVAVPKLKRIRRDGEEILDIDYELRAPGLATSEVVFLDEMFKANTAILNALLGIINERTLTIGNREVKVPLWTVIGASNEIPDDPSLQAFVDRFLYRGFMRYLEKDMWYPYLLKYWVMHQPSYTLVRVQVPKEVVVKASNLLWAVDVYGVLDEYLKILDRLKEKGIEVSDRRKGRILKAIASSALLAGRDYADVTDLEVLIYTVPKSEQEVEAVTRAVDDVLGGVLRVREELKGLRDQLRDVRERIRQMPLDEIVRTIDLLNHAESRVIQLNTPSLSRYAEAVQTEIAELKNLLPDVLATKILRKALNEYVR